MLLIEKTGITKSIFFQRKNKKKNCWTSCFKEPGKEELRMPEKECIIVFVL